ncbi:hypothetical protein L249_0287 [Ophiocordyceps polyrhachis-furcata BCC 54312]|uniref:ATP synthase subunit g n=1 Tax=Ophiocordyceps polyrhachis-furcata BCC 54312 TaxID=1330021 RepID=A0A367LFL8_9HYPO|nr:hypothetical protein L249_0287 [Ophiocordyceps polyrhachis-furcata BCC 54312]
MASSLTRPMLRATRLPLPTRTRLQSSSASTAAASAGKMAKEAVPDKARDYQARAHEGLSRVTRAAAPAIAGAVRGAVGTLGRIGGRTGRLIAFAEKQTPFVVYYSKVGLEMSKIIFRGQNMTPPSLATFQTYYQNLWRAVQSGSFFPSPQVILQQMRSISTTQLVAGGVIAAECLGFFTVGEILGRFKLIGYRGEAVHH